MNTQNKERAQIFSLSVYLSKFSFKVFLGNRVSFQQKSAGRVETAKEKKVIESLKMLKKTNLYLEFEMISQYFSRTNSLSKTFTVKFLRGFCSYFLLINEEKWTRVSFS